eukprot:8213377-Pyramimonas_sp.AAC.1
MSWYECIRVRVAVVPPPASLPDCVPLAPLEFLARTLSFPLSPPCQEGGLMCRSTRPRILLRNDVTDGA